MNKYEPIRVLGQGGYGKAILVKRRSDGKNFVIKEVRLTALSPHERDEATKEAKVLSSLHSPFIVSFEESFQERGCFYIVMEYADGGDLSQKIQSRGNRLFTEEEVLKDFIQLALAIKYIHDRKILHRDLKAQNVFIMRDGTIKLGDFGIARVLERTFQLCNTQIGSPYYLSPEICEGKSYNSKTDIWSLGCILYELCTLRHAFKAANMNALLMNIVRGKFSPIPPTFSKELKQLIQRMLTKDANIRPSINAVLATPIIRSRLRKFYDETLSSYSPTNSPPRQKAQIYRPKLLRGVGGQNVSDQIVDNLEVVPHSKVDRSPVINKDADEVEAIIMQNRETRKKKQKSPQKVHNINGKELISAEEAAGVIYGGGYSSISKDSYLCEQSQNKPIWAKTNSNNNNKANQSPKRIEVVSNNDHFQLNLNSSRHRKNESKIKPSRSNQDCYLNYPKEKISSNQGSPQILNKITTSAARGTISSQRSLTSLSKTSGKSSSISPKKSQRSGNYDKSNILSPSSSVSVSNRRAQSKISVAQSACNFYGGVNDDDFERIFGIQKKEADMNTKKLQELESRQKKLEKPVLPFVDDINRKKLQLQRAEIENKRARMRELQREKTDDEKMIEEIMHELDQDPQLRAAERSVCERCGPYNDNQKPKKIQKSSPNSKINQMKNLKQKSPQQAVYDAHYHLYSVQQLATSIRDALLLTEEDENDTSFVDTSSPSPLLQSQSISFLNTPEINGENIGGLIDQKERRHSLTDTNLAVAENENEEFNSNNDNGRFYLNNKELSFPVVSDGDSLSYRAEAIRAFLERELGIDKLLQIRQRLVDPERGNFDVDFDDVEPGLIILAQQLVILDEMILN